MRNRIEIKTVDDYNEVASDIVTDYLEDFTSRKGLTRDPNIDDFNSFGHDQIDFMYTYIGVKLYDNACRKLTNLGKKLFPDESEDICVESDSMLSP